ncbi:MAG: glycerophosphodiester phosphodiesterase family protein, partial [Pseudomonadota bacterium]
MSWPYPRIVAHRGGGRLAPENTLGAIRYGASLGFEGVEFDVMLAGDGTPVLIHDETVDRTTDGRGAVAKMTYSELLKLNIEKKEKIPTFEQAARLCRELGVWANVEVKPALGHERRTGEAVARAARAHWQGAGLAPVVSSFST